MFEPILLYQGYSLGRFSTGVGTLFVSIVLEILSYRFCGLVSLFDELSHSVEVIVFDIIPLETE